MSMARQWVMAYRRRSRQIAAEVYAGSSSEKKQVCATGKSASGRGDCLVCSVKRVSPHSAAEMGSRERPHTKRRKADRCSGVKPRSAAQK